MYNARMNEAMSQLIDATKQAVSSGTFVKIALSAYKGGEPDLKKITARRIVIKREEKLSFTYRYKTRDLVRNYAFGEAYGLIADALDSGFTAATLFTTEFDLSYPAMTKAPPAAKEVPDPRHDRSKKRLVETAGKKYLQDLKITDASGAVLKSAQDKYRQIDKYVEILSGLIKNIDSSKIKNIVDMGAGKGYLTFALYDYMKNAASIPATVTGVEYRKDLVDFCNKIAQNAAFENLKFVQGTVEDFDASNTDILIALHACDTATDDAIAKGIAAGAELIVVAPCCHKQIRNQIEQGKKKNDLEFLLKYGIFLEREAEMVTDGIRALILEYYGYTTKVFEFISDAHTPKNVMIVATKNAKASPKPEILQKIKDAKDYFGIGYHHLEKAMGL